MRRVSCCALLSLALCVAGCGDDGSTANLNLELAPSAADPGFTQCTADPTVEPAPLPDAVDRLFVSICRYGGAGCESVPLACPDGDHGSAIPDILVPLEADRAFELDARLGSDPLRVEVVACTGETPIARGVADGIRVSSGSARVRLYRFGQSSCAGPRASGGDVSLPAPRALHEAIRLPNGDVLVLGGITGHAQTVPSSSAGMVSWRGAPLQRAVEVYRPSEERFLRVGGDELGRVMFAAKLLPGGGEVGPFRIRVVGGFTVEGDAAAVRFDASQGRSFYGAPLLPTAEDLVTVADSVDLIYDPAGPTLTVEPGAIAGNPRGAANRAGDFAPDIPSAVVLGITGEETGTGDLPRPASVGAFWWLGQDGMRVGESQSLLSARYGHTVSTVPLAGGALVWGGNVNESDLAVVQSNAGELLRTGAPPMAVAGGGLSALPAPVALHTATTLFDDSVLIAGGLQVGCSGGTCGGAKGFSTLYADPALELFRYEAGGFVRTPVEITTPYAPSFLHAAVPLSSGGRTSSVVLLGGATVEGTSRMTPSDQVVRVTSTGVGRFGTTPLGAVPVDGLLQARWGHAATPLDEERLLVTGGLRINGDGELEAIAQAEMISYGEPPTPNPCAGPLATAACPGGMDAGPRPTDSGSPPIDSGPLPTDSGSGGMDAGVSPVDSGL